MKIIRKTVITLGVLVALLAPVGVQTANAGLSLLPVPEEGTTCKTHLDSFETATDRAHFLKTGVGRNNTLGCAIQTGRISLDMIPYFISYITNFFLAIIGLICVLFIVIGGYGFIYGGMSENKEKGKKTIKNALMGVAVASLAWVIVNIIMAAVTS